MAYEATFVTRHFMEPPIEENDLISQNHFWRGYAFYLTADIKLNSVIISTEQAGGRISLIEAEVECEECGTDDPEECDCDDGFQASPPVPKTPRDDYEVVYKEKSQTGVEVIELDETVILEEGKFYVIAVTARDGGPDPSNNSHLYAPDDVELMTSEIVDTYPWLDWWFGEHEYDVTGQPWRWGGTGDGDFYGEDPTSPLGNPLNIGFLYDAVVHPPTNVQTEEYEYMTEGKVRLHGYVEDSGYRHDPEYPDSPTSLYIRIGQEPDLSDGTNMPAEQSPTDEVEKDFYAKVDYLMDDPDKPMYYQAHVVNEVEPQGVSGDIKEVTKPEHDMPEAETLGYDPDTGKATLKGKLVDAGIPDAETPGFSLLYIEVGTDVDSNGDIVDGELLEAEPRKSREDGAEFEVEVEFDEYDI